MEGGWEKCKSQTIREELGNVHFKTQHGHYKQQLTASAQAQDTQNPSIDGKRAHEASPLLEELSTIDGHSILVILL